MINKFAYIILYCFLSNLAMAEDFEAGPIWSNDDAKNKCPDVCKKNSNREWNGHWVTTIWGQMSVCNCVYPLKAEEENATVEAEPAATITPTPTPTAIPTTPAKAEIPAQPPAESGQVDPCRLTCRHKNGVEYTGDTVYSTKKKRNICRCYLDPVRLRARGK